MEFSGKYIIKAPRHLVWQGLNDEEILQKAIFGCTKISWVSENKLELQILVNLGVMKKEFTGFIELSNVEPAAKYTLNGRGKGGVLGKVYASADIELADEGDNSLLQFTANGGGSSALMNFGKIIIGSSAQKIIDRFFERFAKAMEVEIVSLNEEDK